MNRKPDLSVRWSKRLREFKRKHGSSDDGDAGLAASAADEAWGALEELRQLARGDGDFAGDARAVIGAAS